MVGMTQSFSHWLFTNHREIYGLVCFGHIELVTDEMYQDYLSWCDTDEGKEYLAGGKHYDENFQNI